MAVCGVPESLRNAFYEKVEDRQALGLKDTNDAMREVGVTVEQRQRVQLCLAERAPSITLDATPLPRGGEVRLLPSAERFESVAAIAPLPSPPLPPPP